MQHFGNMALPLASRIVSPGLGAIDFYGLKTATSHSLTRFFISYLYHEGTQAQQ